MTEPDGIPERVTRLERELIDVRADARVARLLAAGADHDVSEVRAEMRGHRRAMEALRATQLDHGRAMHEGFARMEMKFAAVDQNFARVDENFARVDENFARVDENFAEIRAKFAVVGEGMEHITTLLTTALDPPASP
jgi:predicted nuclease with TOPRIM domain